jgi:hypothetical protein
VPWHEGKDFARREISAAEAERWASEACRWLRSKGIGPEDRPSFGRWEDLVDPTTTAFCANCILLDGSRAGPVRPLVKGETGSPRGRHAALDGRLGNPDGGSESY